MPRLTRGSLTSKKEEEQVESAKKAPASGRGKRGAKSAEPVEEPLPIGDVGSPPAKAARLSAKDVSPKEEVPKGRTPSRGRGKKDDPPEEITEVNEVLPPKKGGRGGRGKKEEEDKVEKQSPVAKKGSRGGRGKKEEEPEDEEEEEEEEEVVSPTKRGARGGKGKKEPAEAPSKRGARGGRGKKVEDVKEDSEEAEEVAPSKRGGRGGRGSKKEVVEEEVKEEEAPPKRASRGGRGKKAEVEEEEEEVVSPTKRTSRGGRGKKAEPVEEEKEETSPKKAAPRSRGRGGRGSKVEQEVPEEVQEEAEGEKDSVEEGTDEPAVTPTKPEVAATTPSSGGRRSGGRGKKTDIVSPPKVSPSPRSRRGVAPEITDDVEMSAEPAKAQDEVAAEAGETKDSEEQKSEESAKEVPTKEDVKGSEELTKEDDKESEEDDQEVQEPIKEDDKQIDESTKEITEINEEKSEAMAEKEVMEVEEAEEVEEIAPVVEGDVEEEKDNKKRKLEEEEEEESSSKKARVEPEEASVDEKEEEGGFVLVNKEDVPAADSKEVEEALPPPVENKPDAVPEEAPAAVDETEEEEIPVPTMAAPIVEPPSSKVPPTVVPLTEAELAKQYNPTIRDKDDNLSMMVEVGSEAASDIGNMSRNLDVSEAVLMDSSNFQVEPPCQDESVSATSSESSSAADSSASKPVDSTSAVSEEPAKVLSTIPLPTAELQPPQTQPAVASLPASVPADIPVSASPPKPQVVPTPAPQPTVCPPVPQSVPAAVPVLNSIPLPSDVSMSNSSSPPPSMPQQPPPPQTLPTLPSQNSTSQNGSVQPAAPQTITLMSSTPAKKPFVFDSSYVPSSPTITKRKFISNPSFPIELMDPAFCFSVVSYNLLADCHRKRYNYSYTETQYLELPYRHSLILKELEYLDGDIICLQEVDTAYYHNTLLPAMKSHGYQGMFKKRTQEWYDEGEATFVKTSKFEVLSYQGLSLRDLAYEEIEAASLSGDVCRAAKKYTDRAEVVLVCKLLSKKTGKHLTVGNIHVAFTPDAPDLQCIQVASAVKELVSLAGNDLNPYIICGDFNSETTSPAYQLAKDGYLSDEHIRNLQNIQSMDNTEGSSRSIIHYLWKAFQHTSSNMKSAYETSVGKEPALTTYNRLVKSCFDYIFFSSSTLHTVGAMEVLDSQVVEASGGLPTKDIPSDHVSVKATFRLKD